MNKLKEYFLDFICGSTIMAIMLLVIYLFGIIMTKMIEFFTKLFSMPMLDFISNVVMLISIVILTVAIMWTFAISLREIGHNVRISIKKHKSKSN